jgi:hypothetical protein
MFSYVQILRHFCSANTTHTPVAYHLCGAIEKGIARVLGIQETDRHFRLGDLVHNWWCDRILDRRANPFPVAMTLHYLSPHHAQNWSELCPGGSGKKHKHCVASDLASSTGMLFARFGIGLDARWNFW